MSSPGAVIQGQSGRKYRLVAPLSAGKNVDPHVWKAVDDSDEHQQFVVKCPESNNWKAQNLTAFQYELEMQKRFRDDPFIRSLIDFAAGCSAQDLPPWMVLEGFEKTLWAARLRRRLSFQEIRWIMKAVLLGLWTIHQQGLVYSGIMLKLPSPFLKKSYAATDLKMENVVLNGFQDEEPGNVRSIIARLADCGLSES